MMFNYNNNDKRQQPQQPQQHQQQEEEHLMLLYNNIDSVKIQQNTILKQCQYHRNQSCWNEKMMKHDMNQQHHDKATKICNERMLQKQQQHCYKVFVTVATILLIIDYCSILVQGQTIEMTNNNNINNIVNTPIELQWDSIEMILYPKKSSRKKKTSTSSNDNSNDSNKRIILDGSIAGKAIPGRLLGIMGPSGAGKSTLLHALAGLVRDTKNSKIKSSTSTTSRYNPFKRRQTQNTTTTSTVQSSLSGIQLYGNRYMNGIQVDSNDNNDNNQQQLPYCTLIEQEVNFFPYMTVRETLLFRIQLQFGKTNSNNNNTITSSEQLVTTIVQQMNLQSVANTIVGNTKVRGISGGERKRLSIAIELINSPSILMLDEPTSGLDSTAATTIIRSLRSLATSSTNNNINSNNNKTVIAVIHQPSQHIFNLFDDILLIGQGGKQMYYGPRDTVRYYMEHNGCQPPISILQTTTNIGNATTTIIDLGTSTAEFIIDCISLQPIIEWNETIVDAQHRVFTIAQAALVQQLRFNIKPKSTIPATDTTLLSISKLQKQQVQQQKQPIRSGVSIIEQYKLLFIRSFREIIRGKTTFLLKLIQQMTTAIIYGSIYSLNTSSNSNNNNNINNYGSIIDRFGLLNLIVIGILNLGLSKTIRTFPKEKNIISKELSSNLYSLVPYFIAKVFSEVPTGCIINSIFGTTVYVLTGLQRTSSKQYIQFISILLLHGIVTESAGLFISSICPTTDIALAAFPAVIVLSVIFDGRNISEENTPFFLRWVSKVGLIRWAFEGLCVNEFTGLQFAANTNTNININPTTGQQQVQVQVQRYRNGLLKQLQHKIHGIVVSLLSKTTTTTTTTTNGVASSSMILSGIEALNRFGMGKRTVHGIIRIQIKLISSFWLFSYIGLRLTKQKYVRMQKPIAKN